jgi:phosphoribosylformylglycinamidine cyclo-ligase
MTSYDESGVSVSRAEKAMKLIGKHIKSTHEGSFFIKGFGGTVDASFLKKYKHPVLVSTIDGVGTKSMLATKKGNVSSLGEDLVNHCINDLLCVGAKPVFFLDYFAANRLEPEQLLEVVKGISLACKKHGIALVGGETAEMPGVYEQKKIDLAGCMVGVAEKSELLPKNNICKGDILIGLPSSGLHTNGYSLARKIIPNPSQKELSLLLKVHKPYLEEFLVLKKHGLKALVHITGGGFYYNIPRVLPKGLGVKIQKNSFPILPIFKMIQEKGNVNETELFRVFNMGIGMIAILSKRNAQKAMSALKNKKIKSHLIGEVVKGKETELI